MTPARPEAEDRVNAAAPAVSRRPTVDLAAILGGLWLMGTILVLLWQGICYLLVRRRLLCASTPVTGLEPYAAELGLEGRVRFYHCKAVSGPMTLGLWRPAVLLPPGGLAVAALRHELCHVKRHDVAYQFLLFCACALHWFNPLVWLLYRWADRDVEACCDAAVVAGQDGAYRRSYGELLLSAASGERNLPFTTSFGGGKEQMKARLTQLFRPGKRSRVLVCAVLVLAAGLGSLVACREKKTGELADGIYCSPYANVVWPVGEREAEGEDYGSIRLSLLNYNEIDGPHGKPLGEYTLPLSENLMLRQLWWGEDRSAGEKGTQEWQKAVHQLAHAPMYRNSIFPGTEYLVVTVKGGEIIRLSWAQVRGVDGADPAPGEVEAAEPLTENTMPTLVYYDPERDFLLYRTVDTAYFHYGDSWSSYRPNQSEGRRVLWRCDVSEDEGTVYLSDVFDDSENRDERFYAWDIGTRTLAEADAIPAGVDHMTHTSGEELYDSGFTPTADLLSNALQTADGTIVALTIRTNLGDGTLPYLCFTWKEPDQYAQSRFLTPERIPAPRDYVNPDWCFTLHLPESLEGQYYVEQAGSYWLFYDKEQFGTNGGFLLGVWAEDSETFRASGNTSTVLGEKGGVTYSLSIWPEEDMEGVPEERQAAYAAMLRDISNLDADCLDLTAVTRSSGYLWPLPYREYGGDVILSEEDNTLKILSPEGVTVQSAAGGTVVGVIDHPVTGDLSVVVEGPKGWYCEYGHLEYLQAERGTQVKRGDILGFAGVDEEGRRWLGYRLLTGDDWQTAEPVDPWSMEYRTYDFLSVTRDNVTVAGDPVIEDTLRSVLRGERGFYNVETGESCFATAFPDSDGLPVTVYRYAWLDMDNDTIPEVVLWLRRGDDIYQLGSIILQYKGSVVYGYPMGYRSLFPENLKTDGSYSWSGGAFYNGWGKMDFQQGGTVNTIWRDYDKFYVNGNPATEEAFDQAEEEQLAKPDVAWHDFSGADLGR